MAKAKTTSNDALIAAEVDQKTIDAFDLSPHLIRLMWDEPFFASILPVSYTHLTLPTIYSV